MDNLEIDAVIINGTTYIPCRKTIKVTPRADEMELVYVNQHEKTKMRNKKYYMENKQKWALYNENKKKKQINEQTVIEFY